jgi:hypothetical protein
MASTAGFSLGEKVFGATKQGQTSEKSLQRI